MYRGDKQSSIKERRGERWKGFGERHEQAAAYQTDCPVDLIPSSVPELWLTAAASCGFHRTLTRAHSTAALVSNTPSLLSTFPLCGGLRLRMPRIPPTLLRHARRLNRLLPSLLPVCRDLPSSQNELRWLGEHAAEVSSKQCVRDEKRLLQQFVTRRARGEPLQYILGTEFFGDLEIECRPGVLIPRFVGSGHFHTMRVLMLVLHVDRKQLLLCHILPSCSCSHAKRVIL